MIASFGDASLAANASNACIKTTSCEVGITIPTTWNFQDSPDFRLTAHGALMNDIKKARIPRWLEIISTADKL